MTSFTIFWFNRGRPEHPYVALLLPSVFLVFGMPLFWTPISSLAMKLTDIRRQGAAQSLLTGVNACASISAPVVAGLFLNTEHTYLRPLCFLLAALWLANTVTFCFTHKSLAAPNERAQEVVRARPAEQKMRQNAADERQPLLRKTTEFNV